MTALPAMPGPAAGNLYRALSPAAFASAAARGGDGSHVAVIVFAVFVAVMLGLAVFVIRFSVKLSRRRRPRS